MLRIAIETAIIVALIAFVGTILSTIGCELLKQWLGKRGEKVGNDAAD